MIGVLQELIHHGEDQILLIDLGPSDGRTHRVDSIGRPVLRERRESRIF